MVNQGESIHSDVQLDEALDKFELDWSADSRYLSNFVAEHDVAHCPQSLAEFIRADIDRRYAADLDVDLKSYFATFPDLSSDRKVVMAIGFEDFRSRRSRNLSVSSSRWGWMPGIEQASWYMAMRESTRDVANTDSPIPPSPTGIVKRCNDPGEALALPTNFAGNKEPKVGDRFGDFQLLAILGGGSFSTVFLATQLGLASRYVALKVVRRPLDEPTHLARLQHTGIVPLYSVHRFGTYSVLCMPYFGSATLADWFGGNDGPRDGHSLVATVQSAQMRLSTIESSEAGVPLNPKEVDNVRVWNAAGAQPLEKLRSLDAHKSILWLAERLTAALAHAHERGIIHGDLKPANVLIRNDGEPALIDFNLSKNFEQESVAWAGGTLPYMSPEQLRMLLGQTTRIDASSDVYSLGILLFELVEKRLPFPAPLSQADADVTIALNSRFNVARMRSPKATPGIKAIIQKCLSVSTKERYSSALPLLEDIEREIALRPLLHAKENVITGRFSKLVRRYPRSFSAGSVALISILALGLVLSLAIIGWNRSLKLDAYARLTRFRSDSKLFLSELVDPPPVRWEHLLDETTRLVDDVLGEDARPAGNTSEQRLETALKRLNPGDRAAARKDVGDFCLVAIALTCSSAPNLSPRQHEQLRRLLTFCVDVPGSAKSAILAHRLSGLLSIEDGKLQARYESSMRTLEKQFDAANSVDDQHGLIELLQARSDLRNSQPGQAMERLRFLDVNTIPAHLYWMVSGDAQMQMQHLEAAIQAYGLAIGAAPKSVSAYVQRAESLQQLRIYKSAEDDYSSAIALSPSMSSLYMRRALVREKLRNFEGAIDDMNAALVLEPDSNKMLFARARLHHLANHRDDYLADFKKGIAATPADVEDWVSRALAQLPRHPQKAKTDLEAALQINPESLIALQNLAHVESEHLHDLKGAMAALDQILETSPTNETARAGRCVLLARQGLIQECLQDLAVLSMRDKKLLPSTLYQMGCAHALICKQHNESEQQAVRLLALAIRRGYGADIIATDTDLDSLRGEASFDALLHIAEFYKAN